MSVNAIYTAVTKVVKELLDPNVEVYERAMSPMFKDIFRDSKGVFQDKYIGRDWKKIVTFRTGTAGGVQYEGIPGNKNMATDPAVNTFQQYSAVSTFLGLGSTVTKNYDQKIIQLKRLMGNMHIPLELEQMARLGASIFDQLTATIEGTAENVALNKINAFFRIVNSGTTITDGSAATIAQFTLAATTMGTSSTICGPFTLNSGSSMRRLYPGQRVYLAQLGSTSFLTNSAAPSGVEWFVDITDEFAGTFKLIQFSGVNTTITANATSTSFDLVFPNATRGSGAASDGLPTALDHIITSSTSSTTASTTYNLDFGRHRFLRSYIVAENGPFTEDMLFKHIGTYQRARIRWYPDTFYAPSGCWINYFASLTTGTSAAYRWEHNGKPFQPNLGMPNLGTEGEAILFNAFGKVYRLKAEDWLAGLSPASTSGNTGAMYGLYTRDQNFKMITPPRVPGSKGKEGFDESIQFLASSLLPGASDIWLPTLVNPSASGTAVSYTNFKEAPFWCIYEIVPDVMPGIKLTGLSETYGAPA